VHVPVGDPVRRRRQRGQRAREPVAHVDGQQRRQPQPQQHPPGQLRRHLHEGLDLLAGRARQQQHRQQLAPVHHRRRLEHAHVGAAGGADEHRGEGLGVAVPQHRGRQARQRLDDLGLGAEVGPQPVAAARRDDAVGVEHPDARQRLFADPLQARRQPQVVQRRRGVRGAGLQQLVDHQHRQHRGLQVQLRPGLAHQVPAQGAGAEQRQPGQGQHQQVRGHQRRPQRHHHPALLRPRRRGVGGPAQSLHPSVRRR
jgi:hypothetical protein